MSRKNSLARTQRSVYERLNSRLNTGTTATHKPTRQPLLHPPCVARAVGVPYGIEEVVQVPYNYVAWTNMNTVQNSMSQVVGGPSDSI